MTQLERALEAGCRGRWRPGEPTERGARELGRRRRSGAGVERRAVLDEQRRGRLVEHGSLVGELRGGAQEVLVGGRMEAAKRGQQIEAHPDAREAAIVVRGVVAPRDAGCLERLAHLVAAELEERPHATRPVARRQRAKGRRPGRAGEPVEDRLDAIVARVAGRDRTPVGCRVGRGATEVACAPLEVGTVVERCIHPLVGHAELVGEGRDAAASVSLSTPRSACATCSTDTAYPSLARACTSRVESAPPDASARTGCPGASSRSRATNPPMRATSASITPATPRRACPRGRCRARSHARAVARPRRRRRHRALPASAPSPARRAARGVRARRRRARARRRGPRAPARAGARPARASRARRPRPRRAPASRRRRAEPARRPASSDRARAGKGRARAAAAACTAGSSNSSSKSSAPSAASRTSPLSSGVRARSTSPPQTVAVVGHRKEPTTRQPYGRTAASAAANSAGRSSIGTCPAPRTTRIGASGRSRDASSASASGAVRSSSPQTMPRGSGSAAEVRPEVACERRLDRVVELARDRGSPHEHARLEGVERSGIGEHLAEDDATGRGVLGQQALPGPRVAERCVDQRQQHVAAPGALAREAGRR